MRDRFRTNGPDLIADVLSVISPLVFCAVLIVLIDPLGCCQIPAEKVTTHDQEAVPPRPDDPLPDADLPLDRAG